MIGVLGAGQLGRMLALAGYPLGQRFRFLDPHPVAPAGQLAEQLVGRFDEPSWLERFLPGLQVATYEFENVPVGLARAVERHVPVHPPPAALEVSQDRLAEKLLFQRLGIPTAPFHPVESREQLDQALAELGCPAVLKTRRGGYDGKGQTWIALPAEAGRAWQLLGGVPLLLEGVVPFLRELSQLAVRGQDGALAFYPLVENHHEEGMLRLSLAPAPNLPAELQRQAADYAARVLRELDYVGVLAIEFFQHADRLVANEMAPRVHNSGHWTIEGAQTSQFENHLRALLGWPLGPTGMVAPCAMLNLIGTLPDTPAVLALPDAHLHLYGKAPRPRRKLGHLTLRGRSLAEVQERLPGLLEQIRKAGT
jgi:5-(carboxyamino)imidazole ribonucleotide synthase